MSASISATRYPNLATDIPRLAVLVVLPTPPLPLVTTTTRAGSELAGLASSSSVVALAATESARRPVEQGQLAPKPGRGSAATAHCTRTWPARSAQRQPLRLHRYRQREARAARRSPCHANSAGSARLARLAARIRRRAGGSCNAHAERQRHGGSALPEGACGDGRPVGTSARENRPRGKSS
jgi:hypothetical protein